MKQNTAEWVACTCGVSAAEPYRYWRDFFFSVKTELVWAWLILAALIVALAVCRAAAAESRMRHEEIMRSYELKQESEVE